MELARKPSDMGKDNVGVLVFELDTILSRLSKYTLSVKLVVALLAISRQDLVRFSFVLLLEVSLRKLPHRLKATIDCFQTSTGMDASIYGYCKA